jgi:hypothetical protein
MVFSASEKFQIAGRECETSVKNGLENVGDAEMVPGASASLVQLPNTDEKKPVASELLPDVSETSNTISFHKMPCVDDDESDLIRLSSGRAADKRVMKELEIQVPAGKITLRSGVHHQKMIGSSTLWFSCGKGAREMFVLAVGEKKADLYRVARRFRAPTYELNLFTGGKQENITIAFNGWLWGELEFKLDGKILATYKEGKMVKIREDCGVDEGMFY